MFFYCCSVTDKNALEYLGITVQYRVKVRLILGFGCRSVHACDRDLEQHQFC